ncbi:hypothetical protein D3C81_1451950 [compost metagenome]
MASWYALITQTEAAGVARRSAAIEGSAVLAMAVSRVARATAIRMAAMPRRSRAVMALSAAAADADGRGAEVDTVVAGYRWPPVAAPDRHDTGKSFNALKTASYVCTFADQLTLVSVTPAWQRQSKVAAQRLRSCRSGTTPRVKSSKPPGNYAGMMLNPSAAPAATHAIMWSATCSAVPTTIWWPRALATR